jgi:hypothetical protein
MNGRLGPLRWLAEKRRTESGLHSFDMDGLYSDALRDPLLPERVRLFTRAAEQDNGKTSEDC